jgi:hypothetical protein
MTPTFESDAELIATLGQLRPAPEPGFCADLDSRAAAGFPRRGEASRLTRLRERLRATPPRRRLLPAGGVAVAAIVVATAVIATGGDNGAVKPTRAVDDAPERESNLLGKLNEFDTPAPQASDSAPAEGSVQFEEALPEESAGSAAPRPGPYAANATHREVERSASIVLGTDTHGLRDASAGVFEAVHAADGIVLHSSVVDGRAGQDRASFELLIPSRKLSDTLAAISSVAEVRSRREGSDDITAPTVGAREHLADANAKVEGLLGQVAAAETAAQREAAEVELRASRREAAAIRGRLKGLERRASLSHVDVRIETGGEDSGSSGGAWGFFDGVDGAGRLLAIAAGVVVIAGAALLPFALIALLAWALHAAWLRRARRRALS